MRFRIEESRSNFIFKSGSIEIIDKVRVASDYAGNDLHHRPIDKRVEYHFDDPRKAAAMKDLLEGTGKIRYNEEILRKMKEVDDET